MTKQEFMSKVAEATPKEKEIQAVSDTDYAQIGRAHV